MSTNAQNFFSSTAGMSPLRYKSIFVWAAGRPWAQFDLTDYSNYSNPENIKDLWYFTLASQYTSYFVNFCQVFPLIERVSAYNLQVGPPIRGGHQCCCFVSLLLSERWLCRSNGSETEFPAGFPKAICSSWNRRKTVDHLGIEKIKQLHQRRCH